MSIGQTTYLHRRVYMDMLVGALNLIVDGTQDEWLAARRFVWHKIIQSGAQRGLWLVGCPEHPIHAHPAFCEVPISVELAVPWPLRSQVPE